MDSSKSFCEMTWQNKLCVFDVLLSTVVLFSCIQLSNPEHICNFDSGLCSGWSQNRYQDNFDWTHGNGGTLTHGTGPSSGHGGYGGYMYIDAYYKKNNDNAKLDFSVPNSDIGKSSCLKFYYHMYGDDINTLNVYNGNTRVFTKSGNQGNVWLTAKVTLTLQSIVMFEGIRGADTRGDIAIDDVSIVDGICQDCSTTLNESYGQIELTNTRSSDLQCYWKIHNVGIRDAVAFIFIQEINLYKCSEFVKIIDGNGTEVLHHLGCKTFAAEILADVSFGFSNNISIEAYTQSRGRGFKMKFAILKKSLTSAVPLLGWNVTIIHPTFTSFTLQWMKLNTVINEYAKFYVVEIKSIQDFVLTEEMFPGNTSTTVIKGLSSSTKYRVIVFGIDGIGQPYRSLESVITTKKVSCGFRPNTTRDGNVSLAPVHSWPWQVMVTNNSGSQFCGGSLVDPYWVVTAAHCMKKTTPSSIRIRLGSQYRTNESVGTEQDIGVEKIITHENYGTPLSDSNDIALINLASPANLGREVGLICLPDSAHHLAFDDVNKTCWITGWEILLSGSSQPNTLMQKSVPLVSNQRCTNAYPGQIDDSMLCAGLVEGVVDLCQASGGPLMCEFNGTWYLEGVASRADTCSQTVKYGVYAKVRRFKSWLSKRIYMYSVIQPSVAPQNKSSPALVWCAFDHGLCSGWRQSSSDDFDWTLASGRTPSSSTGPATGQGGSGNYMYIEASYPRKPGDNAKLVVAVPNNGNPSCLSFYYHMYGASTGTFSVYSGNTKVFSVSGNQGNKWLLAEKTIYLKGEVTFEGVTGRSYTGDVAIDQVKITAKECTVSCSFDNGLESCFGWSQSNSDAFDWIISTGSTPSRPSSDISGKGKFMYIDPSTQSAGDNAKLHLSVSRNNSSSCLTFYYYMYGWSMGTLNVYNGSVIIFSKSGSQGNRWRKLTKTVQLSDILTFEGIVESYRNDIIAIDNVTVNKGDCPVPISSCDFDAGLCDGWRQSNSDIFDWTRQTGFTPTYNTGPWVDHTSGLGYYMYIETSPPRVDGDNAKLDVSVPGNGQVSCLEFYYHMYGDDMGTLTVFSGNVVVFNTTGNHDNRWIKAERTIHLDNTVIFEGIRGASETGDLAIDDVLITNGSCPAHTATSTFSTTSTSAASRSLKPSVFTPSTTKPLLSSDPSTFAPYSVKPLWSSRPTTFKPSTVRSSLSSVILTFNKSTVKPSLSTVSLTLTPSTRTWKPSTPKPSFNLYLSTSSPSTIANPLLSLYLSTLTPSTVKHSLSSEPPMLKLSTTERSLNFADLSSGKSLLSSDLSLFTPSTGKPSVSLELSKLNPASVRTSGPSTVMSFLSSKLSKFNPSTAKLSLSSELSTFTSYSVKPLLSFWLSSTLKPFNVKPSLNLNISTFSPSLVKPSRSSDLSTFIPSAHKPSLSLELSTFSLSNGKPSLSSGPLTAKSSLLSDVSTLSRSTTVKSSLSSDLSSFTAFSVKPSSYSWPATLKPSTAKPSLFSELSTVIPSTVRFSVPSVSLTFTPSTAKHSMNLDLTTFSPSASLSSDLSSFKPSTGKPSLSLEVSTLSPSIVRASLPSGLSTSKPSTVSDWSTLSPSTAVEPSSPSDLSKFKLFTAKPSSSLDLSKFSPSTHFKPSPSAHPSTFVPSTAKPSSYLGLYTFIPSTVKPPLSSIPSMLQPSTNKSPLPFEMFTFTSFIFKPSLALVLSTRMLSSAKPSLKSDLSTFLLATGKHSLSKDLSTFTLSTAKPSSYLLLSMSRTSTVKPPLSSSSSALGPFIANSSFPSDLSTYRPSTVKYLWSSGSPTSKPSTAKPSLSSDLSTLTLPTAKFALSSDPSMFAITTLKPSLSSGSSPSFPTRSSSATPTSGLPDTTPTTNTFKPATSNSFPSPRTPSVEETQDSIMLELEDLDIEEWDEEKEDDFKREVARIATDYCASDGNRCQFTSVRPPHNTVFTSDMVQILPGYPKKSPNNRAMTLLAFYLKLPQASSDGIVNKDVLKAIVESDVASLEASISGTILRVRSLSPTVDENWNGGESDEQPKSMGAIIGVSAGNGLLFLIIGAIVLVVRRRIRSKKENAEERAQNNYNNAAYYNDSGEPFIEMVRTCSCGIVSDKEIEEHCHAKVDDLYVAADELWKKGSYSNKAYDINSGQLVTKVNRHTCSSGIAHDNEQEEYCHATNNALYVAADEIWRKGSYVNNAQHKGSEELAIKKTTSCSCGIVQSKELGERYRTKNNILYVAADEIWKERT